MKNEMKGKYLTTTKLHRYTTRIEHSVETPGYSSRGVMNKLKIPSPTSTPTSIQDLGSEVNTINFELRQMKHQQYLHELKTVNTKRL